MPVFCRLGSLMLFLWVFAACGVPKLKTSQQFRQLELVKLHGIVYVLRDLSSSRRHLAQTGQAARLERLNQEVANEHRQTIAWFERHFDFCAVRFCYSSQLDSLRAGYPVLLNPRTLSSDPDIPLPSKIYVAEFNDKQSRSVYNSQTWEKFFIEQTAIAFRPKGKRAWHDPRLTEKDVIVINAQMHRFWQSLPQADAEE